MDLKFYLNKILKIDNIEHYTIKSLLELKNKYEEFLNKTGGIDPDYPGLMFGDKKKTINIKLNPLKEDDLDDGLE